MHLSKDAIGHRLQLERKQLGFIQDDFARLLGISKRTLAGYEGGTSDIGASVLARASELGVDVLYVVTGFVTPRSTDSISPDEAVLLDNYRELPAEDRAGVTKIVTAMSSMAGNYKVGTR